MKWHDYFLMFLGLVAPMIWTAITAKHPSFPLSLDLFVELVKWIFITIAGVKLHKLYIAGIAAGKGVSYDKFIKG